MARESIPPPERAFQVDRIPPLQAAQCRAPQRFGREVGNEPAASSEDRQADSRNTDALSPRTPPESGGRRDRQTGAPPRAADERDDPSPTPHDSCKHGRE